jgi:hypothetical protein
VAAIKTRAKLSAFQHRQMLEMLKEPTPAEHVPLKNADFITEDEADIIVSYRRMKEGGPSIPLEQVLKERGIPHRRRSS